MEQMMFQALAEIRNCFRQHHGVMLNPVENFGVWVLCMDCQTLCFAQNVDEVLGDVEFE